MVIVFDELVRHPPLVSDVIFGQYTAINVKVMDIQHGGAIYSLGIPQVLTGRSNSITFQCCYLEQYFQIMRFVESHDNLTLSKPHSLITTEEKITFPKKY